MNIIDQMLKSIEEYSKHFSEFQQRTFETQTLIKLQPEQVMEELSRKEAQLSEESKNIISNLNDFSTDKLFELLTMLSVRMQKIQESAYDKAINYGGTKASLEISKRNKDGRELYSNPEVWAREVVNQEDELKALKNKSQVYSSFIGTVSHLIQNKIALNVMNNDSNYIDEVPMHHPTR